MPENFLMEELETFEKNKENLVRQSEGKYVLIKGKEIVNCFDTENDAIKVGLDRFGNVPFLVKKIERIEQTHNFTSNLIKLELCPH